MSVHTCVGSMLSWTNASIRAGIWLWMIKLQVASKSGIILPRAPQIYHKSLIEKSFFLYFYLLFVLTCLIKSTISCSVVSLVMNSSRSSMMSMQMLQVRSFLVSGIAEMAKMAQASTINSYTEIWIWSLDIK